MKLKHNLKAYLWYRKSNKNLDLDIKEFKDI